MLVELCRYRDERVQITPSREGQLQGGDAINVFDYTALPILRHAKIEYIKEGAKPKLFELRVDKNHFVGSTKVHVKFSDIPCAWARLFIMSGTKAERENSYMKNGEIFCDTYMALLAREAGFDVPPKWDGVVEFYIGLKPVRVKVAK
jgi:hypothetical protein